MNFPFMLDDDSEIENPFADSFFTKLLSFFHVIRHWIVFLQRSPHHVLQINFRNVRHSVRDCIILPKQRALYQGYGIVRVDFQHGE